MNSHPNYYVATNAAYKLLNDLSFYGYRCFPTPNVFEIFSFFPNIKIHSYTEIALKTGCTLEEFIREISPSEFGFTLNKRNHLYIVCYNDRKCEQTIRFTLAHELGHIVLEHVEDNKQNNKEANCFARNFLCPLPVAHDLCIENEFDYAYAFNISEPMAQATIQCRSSDQYYIDTPLFHAIQERLFEYIAGYRAIDLHYA